MSITMTKPFIDGKQPPSRGGHSIIMADSKIISFGGHFFDEDGSFQYLNELWVLDMQASKWHEVSATGQLPEPRYGHCCHVIGSRMFIFGGKGRNGRVFNDVYYLNLLEWSWVEVSPVSASPTPRLNSASCVMGSKIVIHGGWDGIGFVFDDLWQFETLDFRWTEPQTNGFSPGSRYGHTLTPTTDFSLIMFGGARFDQENGLIPEYLTEIRRLDVEAMTWSKPSTHGQVPTGRFGHTSCLTQDKLLIVYGGWGTGGIQSHKNNPASGCHTVSVLDVDSMQWNVPLISGLRTVPHTYCHGGCGTNDAIVMFGGFDGRQATSATYVMHVSTTNI